MTAVISRRPLKPKIRIPEAKVVSVGFIGAGRVGTALASLLHARGVNITGVSGRTLAGGLHMAHSAGLDSAIGREVKDTIAAASIVFLTVPDDAIALLCKEIADAEGWREGQGVVHCSGALPSSILHSAQEKGALIASFHPLQAFANLDAALAHMPGSTFALEGAAPLVEDLDRFVMLLGGTSLRLSANEKVLYHAAAVIASNYTVTLASLASDLLVSQGIAPDPNTALRYLLPLLRGTIDNLQSLGLPDALTGPLARGDVGTVSRHLSGLARSAPELAHLYRHLARLTLPLAVQKGHLDPLAVQALNSLLAEES